MSFRNILFSIVIILPSLSLAQKDDIRPDPPQIDYISVNPLNDAIDVYWFKSPSTDVEKYKIYRYDVDIYYMPIDSTPNADSLHYQITKYIKPGEQTEDISVFAKDSANNESKFFRSHKTVYLQTAYDSCRNSARLTWSAYQGWTPDSYEIMVSKNNSAFNILQSVSSATFNYDLNSLDDTSKYCFYIRALRNDGIRSTSNQKCFQTKNLYQGTKVLPLSVIPNDDQKKWNFSFEMHPPIGKLNYQFLRSANADGPFQVIATETQSKPGFTDVLNSQIYFYKVEGTHGICEQSLFSSALLSPMFLSIEKKRNYYALKWNYYPISDYPFVEFNLYIEEPGGKTELFGKPTEASYHVDYNNLGDFMEAEQVCFYVTATVASGEGRNVFFQSQKICLWIETEVIMPEAFTPNNDGKNDEIIPQFNRTPREYVFSVTDRWGKKVFETKTSGQGWNGTTGSGKAMEGVYVYQVSGTGFNGKKFDKVGYFSLIYP